MKSIQFPSVAKMQVNVSKPFAQCNLAEIGHAGQWDTTERKPDFLGVWGNWNFHSMDTVLVQIMFISLISKDNEFDKWLCVGYEATAIRWLAWKWKQNTLDLLSFKQTSCMCMSFRHSGRQDVFLPFGKRQLFSCSLYFTNLYSTKACP